jgi:hypothetical protein
MQYDRGGSGFVVWQLSRTAEQGEKSQPLLLLMMMMMKMKMMMMIRRKENCYCISTASGRTDDQGTRCH